MNRFLHAHATHPDWRMALALAAAQIEAQRAQRPASTTPTLGWVYLTEAYTKDAGSLVAELRQRWPGVEWVGASGVGIAATGVEYFDEPALALMLAELPAPRFKVFSGARPLGGFGAQTALVHADPNTPELAALIEEMSRRTASGYLFGGVASGQETSVQIAGEVLRGGLSGIAFDQRVGIVSRVTQGCRPIGAARRVTAAERNVVLTLDGEPALDCLLRDAGIAGDDLRAALPKLRQVLVGLGDPGTTTPAGARGGASGRIGFDGAGGRHAFGVDVRVRHLVGLDPARRAIAIADLAEPGAELAFCVRHAAAARRDLTRICAELREEVEPDELTPAAALAWKDALRESMDAAGASGTSSTSGAGDGPPTPGIAGAIYVSCAGRGGPHFGAPSAEMAIVRHALGDVPLVGFFAGGEIAHHHLYGYTGVLTVFKSASTRG